MVALILSIAACIGVLFLLTVAYGLQNRIDVIHRRIDIYYNEFEKFEKVYRTERNHEMGVRSQEDEFLRKRIEKIEDIQELHGQKLVDMDSLKGFVKEWVKQ